MKKIITLFVCMIMFIAPAHAKEINHFYAEAGDITFTDTANSSVALAGDNVETNGKINGVFFGAGANLNLGGEIEYAVIAGETVEVTGKILKDSALAGNVVEIKNGIFERDAVIAATDIEIAGTFNRNAIIVAEKAELINTTIQGNLKLYATNITIGDNVVINGTLTYPEDAKVSISDNSIIGNTVIEKAQEQEITFLDTITQKVVSILSLILIFVIMSLIMTNLFTKIDTKYEKFNFEKGIETFTKGLIILIAVPIIALILMTVAIGISLSFILIALYVIAIYISKIFIAYLIGSKIADKWLKDTSVLVKGLLGFLVIFIISFIPIINSLFSAIILFLGLGILFDLIRK